MPEYALRIFGALFRFIFSPTFLSAETPICFSPCLLLAAPRNHHKKLHQKHNQTKISFCGSESFPTSNTADSKILNQKELHELSRLIQKKAQFLRQRQTLGLILKAKTRGGVWGLQSVVALSGRLGILIIIDYPSPISISHSSILSTKPTTWSSAFRDSFGPCLCSTMHEREHEDGLARVVCEVSSEVLRRSSESKPGSGFEASALGRTTEPLVLDRKTCEPLP